MKTGIDKIRDFWSTFVEKLKFYILRGNNHDECHHICYRQTLAAAFNEGVYAEGIDSGYGGNAGGVTSDGETGIRFFSYNGTASSDIAADIVSSGLTNAYSKITAANISLTSDVQKNISKIAAASEANQSENNEEPTMKMASFILTKTPCARQSKILPKRDNESLLSSLAK